jgi:AraC-like DNA-binding protein
MGETYGLENVPAIVSRAIRKTEIGITEVRSDVPGQGMTELPREDAFMIGVQLRDFLRHEYCEDRRFPPMHDLHVGDTCVYDLRRGVGANLDKPFHSVHMYLPCAALDAIAEEMHSRPIRELVYTPGKGVDDPVFQGLMKSLLPALARPECASILFIDYVTHAMAIHVARTYGGLVARQASIKGGLAPWQEKRALEMLDANLEGSVRLQWIAKELGLSVAHFARAFRQSMGMAPHHWLLQRRVEAAKALLKDRRLSLSEAALAAGFADQSHFTRVFSGIVGMTPGLWRRCLDE